MPFKLLLSLFKLASKLMTVAVQWLILPLNVFVGVHMSAHVWGCVSFIASIVGVWAVSPSLAPQRAVQVSLRGGWDKHLEYGGQAVCCDTTLGYFFVPMRRFKEEFCHMFQPCSRHYSSVPFPSFCLPKYFLCTQTITLLTPNILFPLFHSLAEESWCV